METLPAGSVCPSSDLDDGEVQAAGQQVRSNLQGDSPSPYTVNTSSGERVNPFSGMLRDSGRKDTPVGASWGRATVRQASNPGPLCAPRATAPVSCRSGGRFRRGHRRVHPVIDDNCPAGASRLFHKRAFIDRLRRWRRPRQPRSIRPWVTGPLPTCSTRAKPFRRLSQSQAVPEVKPRKRRG